MSGQNLGQGRFSPTSTWPATRTCASSALIWSEEAFRGDALGKTLSIDGDALYRHRRAGQEQRTMTEGSGDDMIYLPYTNALRLNGSADVSLYMFTSTSKDSSRHGQGHHRKPAVQDLPEQRLLLCHVLAPR